jgi:hypothetical protein
MSSLLIDFTLSLYHIHDPGLSPAAHSRLCQLALAFIERRVPLAECMRSSVSLTGTSQPIEKLHEVLTVPTEPIRYEERDARDGEPRKKARPWSTYEDSRLVAGICRHGHDNWTAIARFVGNGRTRSQCSQRWQRGLDPRLSRTEWTRTEELCLVQLVQCYGDKAWRQVAARLGSRSDVQCRYRYKMIQKDGFLSLPGIRRARSGQIPTAPFALPQPAPASAPPAGQLRISRSVPAALALDPPFAPDGAPQPADPAPETEVNPLVFEVFRDESTADDMPIWY